MAKLVAVSSLGGSPELVCPTQPLYTVAALQPHTEVLVGSEACTDVKFHVNTLQWDVYWICAAVIGMAFDAQSELKQYLSSINPIYARYTECLWAKESILLHSVEMFL